MKTNWFATGCLLLLSLVCVGQQETENIDLQLLDSLPARFNGRLTNLQEIANNYAMRWGGDLKFQNVDGEEIDALTWYVKTIANHEDARNIRFLQLSPEAAQKIGLNLEADQRYSSNQIVLAVDPFESELKRIAEAQDPYANHLDRELIGLKATLDEWYSLQMTHRSPWEMNSEQLTAEVSNTASFEVLRVPRMVMPLKAESGRWQILFPAAIREFARIVAKIEIKDPNPYAKHLVDLLVAVKNDAQEDFNRHRLAIEKSLAEAPKFLTALEFQPPSGWVETGQANPFELQFYSDAFSSGVQIATIQSNKRSMNGSPSLITINHFPDKKIDPRLLFNSWRLLEGMTLLNQEEFESRYPSTDNSGTGDGVQWKLDIQTPDSIPKTTSRTFATLIHHESGTWTISVYGDHELIANNMESIDRFLESIRIPRQISKWIDVAPREDQPNEDRQLGILHRGDSVDLLVRAFGDDASIKQFQKEIVESVSNGEWLNSNEVNPTQLEQVYRLKAPKNWELADDSRGNERAYFVTNDQRTLGAYVQITAIQPLNESQTVTLVGYLRQAMSNDPMSRAEIEERLKFGAAQKTIMLPLDK